MSHPHASPAAPHRDADTQRVEAFSDGVFAIAITLLVLEFKVPHATPGEPFDLTRALLRNWPSLLGYLMSFVTIGTMWANHHNIFRYIRRSNHTFAMLNVGLLLAISFLPYPTAVLAEYLPEPESRTAALVFYSLAIFVAAIMFNLVWRYATYHDRLLGPEPDRATIAAIHRQFNFGLVCYAATVGIAFVSVPVCIVAQIALILLFLLPHSSRR